MHINPVLAGFAAIFMWALLAFLTKSSGDIPPFQLLALSFAFGSLVGLAFVFVRRDFTSLKNLPPVALTIGIGGLFLYHFFYYTAIALAPVAEASLIAYLWPLLIVLFSALLPEEKLRWFHGVGALVGFAGAALLIGDKFGTSGEVQFSIIGYAAALLCALIWSSYSVLSRLMSKVPSQAVTLYCLATFVLSLICHLIFEQWVWPQNGSQFLAIAGLGLMPVGAAFYLWDHAMKNGPIQLLGAASYAAPVLSTLVLIITGYAEPGATLFGAALLVSLGAFIASGRFPRHKGKK